MPKFFFVSDIHSFYDEFILALHNVGFDVNNEDHWLVICGDHFDRGPDTLKLFFFLNELPRRISIRGNHETLLLECLDRKFPMSHDLHNGTSRTILDLAPTATTFEEACEEAEKLIKPFVKKMKNYFETENYVAVHGFIPYKSKNWRTARNKTWERAMWLNSMAEVGKGHHADKTIIAGHFHTSWGRRVNETLPEWGPKADFSPYYMGDKLIAIDGCTAYSHRVNVLVLEDNFLPIPEKEEKGKGKEEEKKNEKFEK